MGTVVQTFEPLAGYNTGSVIAELYVPASGPVLPPGWAFTAPGTNLAITYPSNAVNYGGGNAVIYVDWYCPAATSGTCTWKVTVVAQTPGDAEAVEAADNATSTTQASTVNGTAGGLTRATITVSALDSMAAGDKIYIRVQRDTADTSIAQTVYLTEVQLAYGDGLTGTPGSGDVVGPAAATDNAVARYDTTTGKLIQDSVVLIADTTGNVTGLGTLNTRTIANWVDGPASATSGRVAVYNGTTGKLVQDGTKLETDLVTGPASVAATSNIAVFNGTTGKIVSDGGQTIAQVLSAAGDVDGPGSSTSGNIASFNGTTGKIVQDSGVAAAGVVVGPASVVTGRVASYNGTTGKLIADGGILVADVVTGPASATSGRIATFNGATGKIVQDGGVLGSDLIVGPGSAVSGNIVSFNGTTGKLAQDSGVSATAHAARHIPGGSDSVFPGTYAAGDIPEWSGSAWAPKVNTVIASAGGAISGGSTGLADIPNLTFSIPRAGTYRIGAQFQAVMSGTSAIFFFAWNYTGTVTAISSRGLLQGTVTTAPSPTRYCYHNQIANNAQVAAAWTGTATAETMLFDYYGFITVSTTGTLTLRLNRTSTATTLTVANGTCITIQEA